MAVKKFLDEVGLSHLVSKIKGMPDDVTIEYDETAGLRVKDGGITGDKIAAGTITKDKLSDDVISGLSAKKVTSITATYGGLIPGTAGIIEPTRLGNELLCFLDGRKPNLYAYKSDGTREQIYSTTSTSSGDQWLCSLSDGRVLFTNAVENKVSFISEDHVITEVSYSNALVKRVSTSTCEVANTKDVDGTLYFLPNQSEAKRRVVKLTPEGAFSTINLNSSVPIDSSRGATFFIDGSGVMYAVDYSNKLLYKINKSNGNILQSNIAMSYRFGVTGLSDMIDAKWRSYGDTVMSVGEYTTGIAVSSSDHNFYTVVCYNVDSYYLAWGFREYSNYDVELQFASDSSYFYIKARVFDKTKATYGPYTFFKVSRDSSDDSLSSHPEYYTRLVEYGDTGMYTSYSGYIFNIVME